jgi:phage terminase large subunit
MPYQQLTADTNPDTPTHWLKQRCDAGLTQLIECRHADNPVLYHPNGKRTQRGKAYVGNLERSLTGVRRERLLKGLWVAAEGLIYQDWDPAIHVRPPRKKSIPRTWERYLAVDFGYTNPFVCQWWAVDPDGRLHMYREVYMSGREVEQHAETIKKATPSGEPRPRGIICDHDGGGRAALERTLGMSTTKAKKDVQPGIEAVMARMHKAGDGRPRIFLYADALVERDPKLVEAKKPTCTAEEIPGYIWDLNGKNPKEAPVKVDDHGVDAMRYMVAQLDLRSKFRMAWA